MEDVFGNLIYLIPIALIIFRVLSGLAGAKKKREQQESRKTPDADDSKLEPEVRELLKRFITGEPAPKAAPRPPAPQSKPASAGTARPQPAVRDANIPHWERERMRSVPAGTARKPARKKSVPQPAPLLGEPAPEAAPVTPAVPARPLQTAAAGPASRRGAFMPQNLSPLQQGFVWAELLGPPKGA